MQQSRERISSGTCHHFPRRRYLNIALFVDVHHYLILLLFFEAVDRMLIKAANSPPGLHIRY